MQQEYSRGKTPFFFFFYLEWSQQFGEQVQRQRLQVRQRQPSGNANVAAHKRKTHACATSCFDLMVYPPSEGTCSKQQEVYGIYFFIIQGAGGRGGSSGGRLHRTAEGKRRVLRRKLQLSPRLCNAPRDGLRMEPNRLSVWLLLVL